VVSGIFPSRHSKTNGRNRTVHRPPPTLNERATVEGFANALRERLEAVRGILQRLDQAKSPKSRRLAGGPEAERQSANRNSSILRDARSAYAGVESLLEAPATAAFERGCLLLIGEWGTGKTHSVCDASLARLKDGRPTLLLLAKDFSSRRPLSEAIQSLTQRRLNLTRRDCLRLCHLANSRSLSVRHFFRVSMNGCVAPRKRPEHTPAASGAQGRHLAEGARVTRP